MVTSLYRPFVKMNLYFDKHFIGMPYQNPSFFPNHAAENLVISFTDSGSEKPFMTIASDHVADLHVVGAGCSAQCLPLYRYDDLGNRHDNITDWALAQFRAQYNPHLNPPPKGEEDSLPSLWEGIEGREEITKQDIFHYVYAVLHHPTYREKYKLNLKREFPRIPFYDDFWQWAAWGQQLMDLHLHYETIAPYPLDRTDIDPDATRKPYKAKLKANVTQGTIELDTYTTLSGIPPAAWGYKLGNRSAIEWVLDRYKERKPRDPTIREQFNTYRFVDYKEEVVELIGRVTAVSVATMEIISYFPGNFEDSGKIKENDA